VGLLVPKKGRKTKAGVYEWLFPKINGKFIGNLTHPKKNNYG
jgi:hypothetical protein